METITLKYDKRNPIASKTIKYILSLGVFDIEGPEKSAKKLIEQAESDIKQGWTQKIKTSNLWK